ncbi:MULTISPECIES: inovirus Gp2 family protein [unclassified Pseudomonas]|uniref:inovirus Gp2 family protein n=1 Tax=unclassified Pseudomonas TaxID=196821 RepID=UPI0002A31F50|nr:MULTISPECIES: inovirus Gp2 family protein [unclassified Pseudomonas]UNY91318.1 inovirus Gp2 family protein [Pseudomonas sp. M1]
MPRHPDNTNLHLHHDSTFEGLPVMVEKGPFIEQYLARLKRTIDLTLSQYPRVMAFRVDLRLPAGIDLPDYAYTNEVISRFIESFKAKIEHDRQRARTRNQYAHDCKVRYVWAREGRVKPHYHLLILLNRDAYYTLGRMHSDTANMINRLQEAWGSALGLSVDLMDGLVEIPDNATYRINRDVRVGQEDELPDLFRRASYLCKAVTKTYGDCHHGFGCSRG